MHGKKPKQTSASGGPGARSWDIYKQFITNQSALRFMCRFKSFGTSTHSLLNFSPDIVLSVGGPESLARRSNWDVKVLSIISGKPPGLYLEAESPDPSEWETAEPELCFVKSTRTCLHEGNEGPIFCRELRKTTTPHFHVSQPFNFTSESRFMPVLSGTGGRREMLFLDRCHGLRMLNLRRTSANVNPRNHSPHTADGQKLIVKAEHGAIYQWPF